MRECVIHWSSELYIAIDCIEGKEREEEASVLPESASSLYEHVWQMYTQRGEASILTENVPSLYK